MQYRPALRSVLAITAAALLVALLPLPALQASAAGEADGAVPAGAEGQSGSVPASVDDTPSGVPDVVEAELPVARLYEALGEIAVSPGIDHEARTAMLEPVVAASYDLPFMSAKVLGRHWRKLPDEDRLRWIDTFSRLTIDTYAERFTGSGGEQFSVLGVEPSSRETALVRTEIVPKDDEPVSVDYRLHYRNGSWRIVDVYLNGTVSELALRRSEYSSVMKRDGLEILITELDQKIADRASNP